MPFHRSHNQAEQPKLQHPGYKFRLRSKTGLKVLEISPAQRARDNSQKRVQAKSRSPSHASNRKPHENRKGRGKLESRLEQSC
jgi:hypothetical protein